jgi:hypothetical protein
LHCREQAAWRRSTDVGPGAGRVRRRGGGKASGEQAGQFLASALAGGWRGCGRHGFIEVGAWHQTCISAHLSSFPRPLASQHPALIGSSGMGAAYPRACQKNCDCRELKGRQAATENAWGTGERTQAIRAARIACFCCCGHITTTSTRGWRSQIRVTAAYEM